MDITIGGFSSLLWSVVSIVGAVIILWAVWQVVQIVRNLKEYGLDYIGFMRGELYSVAKKYDLQIMKPSQKKRRIHTILFEEREDEFEKSQGESKHGKH